MAKPIATVEGVALAPGVSRNGRLYTKRHIAGMVARVQDKLTSGESVVLRDADPVESHMVTQLTHHAAEDDSTRIVGRVTAMSLDDQGRARFRADIAPTEAGKTIATLLDTTDGRPPFLRGVSGRMQWVGGARIAKGPDGQPVETGDELDLLGLDYTHKPGVPQAAVDSFAWTDRGTKTETSDPVLIYESVQEAHVTAITEETAPAGTTRPQLTAETAMAYPDALAALAGGVHIFDNGMCLTCPATEAAKDPKKPYGDVTYADPGYQKDGKKRYPLDTEQHVRAAWGFVNKAKNAAFYTAAQLKRIKSRIKSAMAKIGAKVSSESEGWVIFPPRPLTGAVAEHYMGDSQDSSGSYSLTASNGPTTLTMYSYSLDPADLDVILRAAADAACKALAALDPDMDGDIDVDGVGPNSDTDDDAGETEDDPAQAGTTDPAPAGPATTPAPEPAAGETTEGDPVMAESTNQAAEATTAAPAGLTPAEVAKIAADAVAADRAARKQRKAERKARESQQPAAGTVAETTQPAATPAAETEDQKIDRLVREKLAAEFPAETDDERITRVVSERFDATRAAMVQSGQITPGRKGIVLQPSETTGADSVNPATGMPASWGDKPLHQMSQEEFDQRTGPVVVRHVLKDKADLLA